jgi:hypothetical protein
VQGCTSVSLPSGLLHENDVLDGGAILPGFSLAVSRLFVYLT